MSQAGMPDPFPTPSWWQRLALAALKGSTRVSPRPAALVVRRLFAEWGGQTAAALNARAPAGVHAVIGERYGDRPDERLDVYTPADGGEALPLIVWVHGGAWVGGDKAEVAGYLRMLAARGFAVAAPNYARAPGARYPGPLRQMMAALAHLRANAERGRLDPTRIVLAGDSAGAQIAAQVAALITDPAYAEAVGVGPSIPPECLRGVALCCGFFDLTPDQGAMPDDLLFFYESVMWAYAGTRDYRNAPAFQTMTVVNHATARFPPAFLTVGNVDPLRRHSETFAAALQRQGVAVETLFWPPDHDPPLNHEYQFDFEQEAATTALERIVAFAQDRTRPA